MVPRSGDSNPRTSISGSGQRARGRYRDGNRRGPGGGARHDAAPWLRQQTWRWPEQRQSRRARERKLGANMTRSESCFYPNESW